MMQHSRITEPKFGVLSVHTRSSGLFSRRKATLLALHRLKRASAWQKITNSVNAWVSIYSHFNFVMWPGEKALTKIMYICQAQIYSTTTRGESRIFLLPVLWQIISKYIFFKAVKGNKCTWYQILYINNVCRQGVFVKTIFNWTLWIFQNMKNVNIRIDQNLSHP